MVCLAILSLLALATRVMEVAAQDSSYNSSSGGSYSASKNSSSSSSPSDADILNFALTLENLESLFYKEGLKKFSVGHFRRAGFHNPKFVRDQFVHIGSDEATHVTALSGVISSLGAKPVPSCQFDFSGVRKVQDFLAVARALEQTGVSAYAGAAGLISDKNILTAAATIATVEARHSSFLNVANGGIPVSEPFDTALDGGAILAIAGAFIKKCPFDLGIQANTPLAIKTKNIQAKSKLQVAANVKGRKVDNRSNQVFCSFLHGGSSVTVPASDCSVPADVAGFAYVLLTNSPDALTTNKNSILAGPALFFVDSASHSHSSLL